MPEASAAPPHDTDRRIDLVVRGADVHTLDPDRPRAWGRAARDGRLVALGTDWDIEGLVGPGTRVVDAGGRMIMPGLADVHAHLGFGGQAAAWELNLPPMCGATEILAAVQDRARSLGPDEWVVGGVLVSPVFQAVGTARMLAALDEVSEGRPVMLRDDSLHNRWVNSRALEILGIGDTTPDPPAGRYVRDEAGHAVGLLLGAPATDAELAARRAVEDAPGRDLRSARTAVAVLNSVGVTAAQDAATMGSWLDVFTELDRAGDLTAWIVGSMPAREFIESGPVGPELFDTAPRRRSPHVRPDFVKAVLDGVPMTRTSKFLEPYRAVGDEGGGAADGYAGESLFTDAELLLLLEEAVARGLHAKLHATADGTVRQVLKAVQRLRERHGDGPVFHLAHPEFVHPDDVARFHELDVVADASPVLWFPNPMNGVIAQQVQDHYMERIWPLRELYEAGTRIAAGSDWPVATALPNPWLSIETMVTRRNPDSAFPGELAPAQALDLTTALAAHTVGAVEAMGLSHETGRLKPGMSADFIILDRALFDIPVQEIHATQVLQTWFAGRQVHSHNTAGAA
ncbi:amidohydrolase [Streptomyces sp. 8L]|uniref:amidohydrolase n=1 Tax=Streptomyces sp. 8L TaxID=2877242 RepID=UPI001CD7B8DD|nr:amidohydrolase [Streptomyces sp. 8L]MCA1223267.1 amidohydrolase [Streptomyces sp. 8L]